MKFSFAYFYSILTWIGFICSPIASALIYNIDIYSSPATNKQIVLMYDMHIGSKDNGQQQLLVLLEMLRKFESKKIKTVLLNEDLISFHAKNDTRYLPENFKFIDLPGEEEWVQYPLFSGPREQLVTAQHEYNSDINSWIFVRLTHFFALESFQYSKLHSIDPRIITGFIKDKLGKMKDFKEMGVIDYHRRKDRFESLLKEKEDLRNAVTELDGAIEKSYQKIVHLIDPDGTQYGNGIDDLMLKDLENFEIQDFENFFREYIIYGFGPALEKIALLETELAVQDGSHVILLTGGHHAQILGPILKTLGYTHKYNAIKSENYNPPDLEILKSFINGAELDETDLPALARSCNLVFSAGMNTIETLLDSTPEQPLTKEIEDDFKEVTSKSPQYGG